MKYKSGETPQKNDEVMGEVAKLPARGRVLAVRENGDILLERRAPYEGNTKPLAFIHDEVPAEDFKLVYRPVEAPPVAKAAPKVKKAVAAGAASK